MSGGGNYDTRGTPCYLQLDFATRKVTELESKLEARDRDIDNMSRALNAMRFEVERCQQALGQAQREAASMRATNAALLADNDRLYALVQSCPVEFEPEEGETGYEP